MEEKILTFQKEIAKIPLPSPHLATINSEFTAAWRGAIYTSRNVLIYDDFLVTFTKFVIKHFAPMMKF